jgi:nucleotide-binding universal stress UspA family protein
MAGPRFRHILCPVDFSEYSRIALRHGGALAQQSKSRLTVLFVNDPLLGSAAAAAAYDVSALEAKTRAELKRFVTRALGDAGSGATIATTLGHPAPEIVKAAGRLGADLVVMGSRGLTGPGKWFFGSTTERVLRKADVPLLVVPKLKHGPRAAPASATRGWPGKRVLVPIDLADYLLADARAAVDAARSFGATPVLMYALPQLQFPSWLRMDSGTYDRERRAAAQAELQRLGERAGGGVECQVVLGEPAEEIVAAAGNLGIRLIVVTIKRAATPFGPRQGAIAYRVLASEIAPILAIPGSRRAR